MGSNRGSASQYLKRGTARDGCTLAVPPNSTSCRPANTFAPLARPKSNCVPPAILRKVEAMSGDDLAAAADLASWVAGLHQLRASEHQGAAGLAVIELNAARDSDSRGL